MTGWRWGLVAILGAAAMIWALPASSPGQDAAGNPVDQLDQGLRESQAEVQKTVQKTLDQTAQTVRKTTGSVKRVQQQLAAPQAREKDTRATATDPARQPPVHGTNPHGQGGVAVIDINPSNERPLGGNPNGSDAGPEEIVAGRARGEQGPGGYHGHITIAALFGTELIGVDSTPGQSVQGPLQPLQQEVLDRICDGSAQQICLSVLTANSATTATGSTNDFAVARGQIGGANGLGIGAAESKGNINEAGGCQTSDGSAKTANVSAGGGAVATVANSASSSKSCTGQAPQVAQSSSVIGLGGTQVPIPAPGCADGTPDTVTGIPAILPIVCNADEVASATAVREALDVFVLQAGGNSLAKETTASSESLSVAPAAAAPPGGSGSGDGSDGGSGSGDGSGNAGDGNSGSGSGDDGDGGDSGSGSGDGDGGNRPECSDGTDNDGDGRVDADDPGCHTDGDASNDDSYDASDDSEGDGAAGADGSNAGSLPFTGTDVVGITLAGLMLLAGGLLLRRREGTLGR